MAKVRSRRWKASFSRYRRTAHQEIEGCYGLRLSNSFGAHCTLPAIAAVRRSRRDSVVVREGAYPTPLDWRLPIKAIVFAVCQVDTSRGCPTAEQREYRGIPRIRDRETRSVEGLRGPRDAGERAGQDFA